MYLQVHLCVDQGTVILTVVKVVALSSRGVRKMVTSFNLQLPETTEEQVRSIAKQEQRSIPETVVMLTDEAIRGRRKHEQEPRTEREPWRERLYLSSYRYIDVAQLVQVTPRTVARWRRTYGLLGQRAAQDSYSEPLSYLELITIAFIAAFRRVGVELDDLRQVHDSLRNLFDDEYPFTLEDFKTRAPHALAHLPVDQLSRYGIILRQEHHRWSEPILDQFERFDYERGLALRWYPRGRNHPIIVNALVAFGSPTVEGTGVPTYILKQRYVAGETLEETADDFGMSVTQLREALLFEGVHLGDLPSL